jgi:hypothetical protein
LKALAQKVGLLLWIFIAIACAKKDEPKILAHTGGLKITVDEFRRRFEFTPRLRQYKDLNEAKANFLGSLMAEKLLAQEAFQADLIESARTRAFLEQIRREAAIEELYNVKIASKIRKPGKRLDNEAAGAEFMKYFKQMMVGKKTEVPAARLKYLAERLEEIFQIDEDTTAFGRKLNPSPMSEAEFSQARQGLEANLDETLVAFDDGGHWTIR